MDIRTPIPIQDENGFGLTLMRTPTIQLMNRNAGYSVRVDLGAGSTIFFTNSDSASNANVRSYVVVSIELG